MTDSLNQMSRQHVFVCGPPRSGTTALARVLNSHQRIGMGMERFKKIMNRKNIEQFTPELFEKERFFDFSDGHTNKVPEADNSGPESMSRYYDELHARFDDLSCIGDKVPGAFRAADLIHERFPNCRILFIIRDIVETACSWQVRAERDGDTWPETKTATAAVKPWNVCLKTFDRLKSRHPEDFHLVDYRAFFDGDPQDMRALDRLCRFIGIEADEAMRQGYSSARRKYAEGVKDKPRRLNEATLQFIQQNADLEAYERLIGADSASDARHAA